MTLESLVIGPHHRPVNMSLLLAHTEIKALSSYIIQLVKIQPFYREIESSQNDRHYRKESAEGSEAKSSLVSRKR